MWWWRVAVVARDAPARYAGLRVDGLRVELARFTAARGRLGEAAFTPDMCANTSAVDAVSSLARPMAMAVV